MKRRHYDHVKMTYFMYIERVQLLRVGEVLPHIELGAANSLRSRYLGAVVILLVEYTCSWNILARGIYLLVEYTCSWNILAREVRAPAPRAARTSALCINNVSYAVVFCLS